MPTYVAMKLVDTSGIYAQIVPVIAGSIAHIDVHLDQLIGTCIGRFQVSGKQKKRSLLERSGSPV